MVRRPTTRRSQSGFYYLPDRPRRLHQRDVGDPGGVVRPGAHRRDLRRRGRGRRDRQRQHLRPGRRGLDPGRRQGPAGRRPAADGHGLDQRLPPVRAAGRVGRLQAVRHRPRARAWPASRSTARPSTSGTTSAPPSSAGSRARRGGRWRRDRYDVVIVGGGSAGCALANRLSADSGTSVLVLEAGHSDWKIDPFIHMPAALPFPIGSRFYDWRYETDPEPHLNGRRVEHARGKVLGGSSQHQRDDLPARQPDGLRALGRRARDEGVGLRPLPALLQADGDLPRTAAPTTGAAATARWCSSAARPRTRCSRRSSRRSQEAGYPLTDDVNGYRQEGFARFDRNLHRGRRLSAARAYLHPVRHRKNLDVETLAMATRVRFEGKRAVGVDYLRGGRLRRTVDAGEVILCGGAINTPQLLQLSGVGDESLLARPRHRRRPPLARRRREPPGPPRGLRPVRLEAAGLDRARAALAGPARHRLPVAVPPARPRRHQPLRGRRLRRAATTTSPTRT